MSNIDQPSAATTLGGGNQDPLIAPRSESKTFPPVISSMANNKETGNDSSSGNASLGSTIAPTTSVRMGGHSRKKDASSKGGMESGSEIFGMSQRPTAHAFLPLLSQNGEGRGDRLFGGRELGVRTADPWPLSARDIFAVEVTSEEQPPNQQDQSLPMMAAPDSERPTPFTQSMGQTPAAVPPPALTSTSTTNSPPTPTATQPTSIDVVATTTEPPPVPPSRQPTTTKSKTLDIRASQELSRNVAMLMRQYELVDTQDGGSNTSSNGEGYDRPPNRSETPKPPSVKALISLLQQYENTIDDYLLIESVADLGLGPMPTQHLSGPQQQQNGSGSGGAGVLSVSISTPIDGHSPEQFGSVGGGGTNSNVFIPPLAVLNDQRLGVPVTNSLGNSFSSNSNVKGSTPNLALSGNADPNQPTPLGRSPLIPIGAGGIGGGGGGRYRGALNNEDWDGSSCAESMVSERRQSTVATSMALQHFQSKLNTSRTKRRSLQQVSMKSDDSPLSATVLSKNQRLLTSPNQRSLRQKVGLSTSVVEGTIEDSCASESFHSSMSYFSSPTPSIYAGMVDTASTSPRDDPQRLGISQSLVPPNSTSMQQSSNEDTPTNTSIKSPRPLVGSGSGTFGVANGGGRGDGDFVMTVLSSSVEQIPAQIGTPPPRNTSSSTPIHSNTSPVTKTFPPNALSRKRSNAEQQSDGGGTDMLMMTQARREAAELRKARDAWRAQHKARADQRRNMAMSSEGVFSDAEMTTGDGNDAQQRERTLKRITARRARFDERREAKRLRKEEKRKEKATAAAEKEKAKKKLRPVSSKKKSKELGDQDNNNYTQEQLELLGKVADMDDESVTASGQTTARTEAEAPRFSFRQIPAWIEGIQRTRLRQQDDERKHIEKLADEGIFSFKFIEIDDHAETVIPPEIMSENYSTAEQRDANKFLDRFNTYAIYTVFLIALIQIVYIGDILFRCSFDVPYVVAGYVCEMLFLEIPAVSFTFFRGFYFPIDKKGVYIVDNKIQRQKYVKSIWFALDIFGALPIEIIGFAIGSQCTYSNHVVCAFLSPYWKVNRIVILRSFAEDTSTVLEEISLRRGMHPSIARVTTTFLQMLGISHVAACIFNVMLVFEDYLVTQWLVDKNYDSRGVFSKYLQALDWSTKSVVGFAKGNPFNVPIVPVIFTLIVAFFGIAVFASFIGAITAYLQRPTAWNNTLTAIDSVLDEFNRQEMPKDIINEATTFYWHLYETARHSDSVITALEGLPKPLQVKLLSQIGSDLLRKVPLLRPEVADQKFVMCLTVALVPSVMVPYTVLFRKGDKGDSMAFITHGKLGVVPPTFEEDYDLNSVFFVLKAGSYVGEIALILGVPRTATVSSLDKYANLLVMHKDDFSQIAKDFPSAARRLRIEAESRLSSSLAKGSDALNFERARRLFDAVSDDRRRHCYGLWLAFTVMRGEMREDEEIEDEMGETVYNAIKHLGEEVPDWGYEDEGAIVRSGGDEHPNDNSNYYADDPNTVQSLMSMPDEDGGGSIMGGRQRSGTRNAFARRSQQTESTTLQQHTRRYSSDHTDPDGSIERINAKNNSVNNRHSYFPPATQQGRGSIEGPFGALQAPSTSLVSPLNKYMPGEQQSSSMEGSSRKDLTSVDLASQLAVGANQKGPSAARLRRVVAYIEHVRQREKKNKRRSTVTAGGGGVATTGRNEAGSPFYDVVMQAIQAAKLQQQQQPNS